MNISIQQGNLRDIGLPSLSHIEAHVMKSLLAVKTIVSHLMGIPEIALQKGSISIMRSFTFLILMKGK